MDDQTFNLIANRIQTIFDNLKDALGLKQVRFKLSINRDPAPEHMHDGSTVTASMHPSWEYSTSVLQIYAHAFLDLEDEEIIFILLHEIMHYALHPMSRYGEGNRESDMLEEKVCTELAQMVTAAMECTAKEVSNTWKGQVKKLEKELKKSLKEKVA